MTRTFRLPILAIALAIIFNVPYAILATSYDYPDVLRRPAGEALNLFAAGGGDLILTARLRALCLSARADGDRPFADADARR